MLTSSIFELIKNTSTKLPSDVIEALIQAKNHESKDSNAEMALDVILKNIEIASQQATPICQDTGFPSFFVKMPDGMPQKSIKEAISKAVEMVTEQGFLRPNAVDSLTGENTGNIGIEFPKIYFEESPDEYIHIDLLLKGGGSENVSDQISLPAELKDFGKAGRNLEGVKKAVLQVVKNAQGKGCAPGIVSVHIGADRSSGYYLAKKGLLHPVGENNQEESLQKFSAEILKEANNLSIGPMGFGGKTTLLDCKISVSHRLPASFFVSVVYMCWASRRGGIVVGQKGELLASSFDRMEKNMNVSELKKDNIKRISFPTNEEEIRSLRVGDIVLLNGKIFTGRDRIHAHFVEQEYLPEFELLKNSAIYHCGPVMLKSGNIWKCTAAGPTTSIREEPYQAEFIEKTGIRAVIGKGGMGEKTSKALQENGAVYLHAIGGAAAFYAQHIKNIPSVHYGEFGIPEALWEMEVENFLCVVTMDSRGNVL